MAKNEKRLTKSKSKRKREKDIDEDIGLLIQDIKRVTQEKKVLEVNGKKESELEEDLEIGFEDVDFTPSMPRVKGSGTTSTVLEKVALSAPRPIFVGTIPQGALSNSENQNENDFKYIASTSEKKEPMYVDSTMTIYKEPERVNVDKLGRGRDTGFREASSETFLMQQDKRVSSQTQEKMWRTERFEAEKPDRRDEFEKREVKYERYRPKWFFKSSF